LATARRLSDGDFAGAVEFAAGLVALKPSALAFGGAPISDFFWIAIFFTHLHSFRTEQVSVLSACAAIYLWIVIALAATTLLADGLVVSSFDLPEVLGAVFLLTSDFFSIAIVVSPDFNLTALRITLVQADGQT
jgi:hypothetical protein